MPNYPIVKKKELFRESEDIFIQKSSFLPKYLGVMHSHDFIEMTYILSGECIHVENNEQIHAKKGDLFVVNYGIPHTNISKPGSEPFLAYDCAFTPDFLDQALSGSLDFLNIKASFLFSTIFPNASDFSARIQLTNNVYSEFQQIMEKMLSEYLEQSQGYIDLLRTYLIELIIKMFRKLGSGAPSPSQKQYSYIDVAVQYMQNNYSKKISLEDIAYRSFISKSYLSQLFKTETGQCFSDHLQKIRIEHACEMLRTTNKTIEQISLDTGFCDTKFFYTVFKKLTGETPNNYRKTQTNDTTTT